MNFKKFNLLVISDRYPHERDTISSSFVKSQVDCMAKYFDEIYVISLTPNVPKCLSTLSFMNPRWQRDALAHNYKYRNISVYFTKHFALPFDFSRKRRGDTVFRIVDKIIKDEQIEFLVIHAHFIYPSGYVGAKLKGKYSRPLVITGHGHDVYDLPFKSPGWMTKIKKILDISDHIITPSKSNYDKLMQMAVPSDKVSVIPNGYDSTIFKRLSVSDARSKLNIPADKRVILSVGNLEIEKGHKYLAEAMSIISKRRTDIVCFIVGSGGQKKQLASLINRLEISKFLKLVGSKPHYEIPIWMNACDVFVLPSLKESFGIVQIEAMACGKAVVATINGGSEEIVVNNKLGTLVEPKNAEVLAEAIVKALDFEWDEQYIHDYAEQYTWHKMTEELGKIYNCL